MYWFSIGTTFQDNENVPQEGEVMPCIRVSGSGCSEVVDTQNSSHMKD